MRLFEKKDIRKEFLPSALEIIETPESPLGKLVIWIVALIIIIAIIWSIVGKVDEVAIVAGKVIPDGNVKVIQASDGGVITSIDIKEGEKVKKGQLIMKLDTSILEAEKDKIENALNTTFVERKLLLTTFNKGNLQLKDNGNIKKDELARQLEYNKMKEAQQDQKQQAYENSTEKIIKEFEVEKQNLKQIELKIQILSEEEQKLKKLYEDDSIPQQQYIDKKNELDLAKQSMEIQKSKIDIYEKQVELNKNQKIISSLDYDKNTMKEIVEKDKTIQTMEKELEKIKNRIQRQTIVSPVDGTVQSLSVNTIGGVIETGKPIVTVVPDDSELLIEGMILNKDIAFVNVGQSVEIKLDTFPFQKYGTIKGKVVHISPDAVQNEKMGYVYKALIKPSKNSIFVEKKEVNISTGMTAVVEVKTGTRRIIEFFLPGIKEIKECFQLR
ncbi:HlyD family type I secretion periplasmic adaptor subunit [Tepidibacter sp. Z1-5]|uniref:HlyD family type I secretion periplasmic adaptor subunit n=1 Tax=Tepidibacter sp. Z1-5 TaxID=3134138 RepID=UPI0030C0E7BE